MKKVINIIKLCWLLLKFRIEAKIFKSKINLKSKWFNMKMEGKLEKEIKSRV